VPFANLSRRTDRLLKLSFLDGALCDSRRRPTKECVDPARSIYKLRSRTHRTAKHPTSEQVPLLGLTQSLNATFFATLRHNCLGGYRSGQPACRRTSCKMGSLGR
jgi:hypothetical protein